MIGRASPDRRDMTPWRGQAGSPRRPPAGVAPRG